MKAVRLTRTGRVAEECELPGVALLACPPLGGMFGKALRVFLHHPLWTVANAARGFEQPWGSAARIANALLGGDPPEGGESSCVLKELMQRPTAFPENVQSPALLLIGEWDALLHAGDASTLQQRLPSASAETVAGATHELLAAGSASRVVELISGWQA